MIKKEREIHWVVTWTTNYMPPKGSASLSFDKRKFSTEQEARRFIAEKKSNARLLLGMSAFENVKLTKVTTTHKFKEVTCFGNFYGPELLTDVN